MSNRGGARWRQGANACIFNPAVSCDNEPPLEGHISRVIKITPNEEQKDVKYETILKNEFPDLVRKGWVSVYTKICNPKYVTKDSLVAPGFPTRPGGCTNIVTNNSDSQNQLNLITPIQGETFFEKIKSKKINTPAQLFNFLEPVFSAAIALVPDNGPWLINMDLHASNILTNKESGLGMMADWDQSLYIHPKDDVVQQVNSQISNNEPCLKFNSEQFEEKYYQWSARGIDSIKLCKKGESLTQKQVNALRIWTIRTVFTNAIVSLHEVFMTFSDKSFKYNLLGLVKDESLKQRATTNFDLLDQVLMECNNQLELDNVVKVLIQGLGGGQLQPIGGKKTRRNKRNRKTYKKSKKN